MARSLLVMLRRRWVWLALLLTVWLLCSGQAQAAAQSTSWSDRLSTFPDWGTKPSLPAAQGDLIYPDWLRGDWQLTSTLVDLAAPLAPDLVSPGFAGNQDQRGVPVTCPVRFVAVGPGRDGGRSPGLIPTRLGPPQTVADRAYNGLSLARAYLGDVVQRVGVDPNNPNRQITHLTDNRQLESTVTARATAAPSGDRFLTVERFQQVFRGGVAVPYFNEVETTTDYRHTDDGILADQVTAVYLSPQDPDFLKAQNRPIALYRYQLELHKG